DGHHDLDLIVFATGFNAVTGAFDSIDIEGIEGLRLRDEWSDGPRTLLGIGVSGFPNLFITVGPHNAAAFCNMPRCIEHNVEWVSDLIASMRARGMTRVDATREAQDAWTIEVVESADRMLFSRVDSWFTGKRTRYADRKVLLYTGGFPKYRERCAQVAENEYEGFVLD
ncbi:MAG TPA: cyclohexanone monooxygenase, partial [Acidimicrobiales bacterium]|nr:cyclohexanone monooxygenase [Acidimicrobiales bacterium]